VAAKKSRDSRRVAKRTAASRTVRRPATTPVRAKVAVVPDQPASVAVATPRPFIVGIGASAGGLEAVEAFFDNMPNDSGMIFVVVTHQHPKHPSLLPELISRRTGMTVARAIDHAGLEANHVYVNSPGQNLALLNGALQIMEIAPGPGVHLPIDYFFRSLARDQEERALCIVLSGTGTDGTLGLRAIKGQGGMAMVQDEASAHYPGMPHSAAATMLADYVLRPEHMPAQLLSYAQTTHSSALKTDAPDNGLKPALSKIFVLIRNRTGHDFSGYKHSTMERRIERRMRVHQLHQAIDYVRLLQAEPHELELLFHELLITVTQFFRDPQAFDAIESDLAKRFESQPEEASLRMWVPGCSTGEEPYSLAMLALELADRAGKRLHLQIFATDLDPHAIEVARAGLYPAGIAADVGVARLQRFFSAEAKGYQIRKAVRDCVVFATHNLLRDPPFTKLDVLSCRNLLIYLNSELQQRLFPLFHYALKPGGLLCLGTSESASHYAELFVATDRKAKLYLRRDTRAGSLPSFDLRLNSMQPTDPAQTSAGLAPPNSPTTHPQAFVGLARSVERVLIERFAPATLVVTERGEIIYINGRTGAFLEPSVGEPRYDLFTMAREGLRLCLQSAIRSAKTENREIVHRGISVETNGGLELVTVIVRRIEDPESLRGLYRVSFAIQRASTVKPKAAPHKGNAARTHFERELRNIRDSLQGTLDELQTSNEELKSANEELQSTNEELQSSNEELETSKEEMQALNEELHTLNIELQLKVDELAQVNDDMQNLLNGTDIATLFLDRQLRIKRFTEQARRVVRLIDTDVGRPIGDLVRQVRYERLTEDAQQVLHNLLPHETEVQSLDGHWLWVRIVPYRTAHNVIDGVVITFVDIDRLKRAELLAAANAFAESIVQTVREPLLVLDRDFCIVSTNRAFSRLVGQEAHEILGQPLFEIAGGVLAMPQLRTQLEAVLHEGRPIEAFEFTLESAEAGRRHLQLNARRLEETGASAARVPLVLAAVSVITGISPRGL
jgi:two-component system CheB/CheR fusion protein